MGQKGGPKKFILTPGPKGGPETVSVSGMLFWPREEIGSGSVFFVLLAINFLRHRVAWLEALK